MMEWLLHLPVVWMGFIIFATIYVNCGPRAK